MKILAAPDSYKGSLSAKEVAMHIKEGILAVTPEAEVYCMPIADGGEGTVEAIVDAANGKLYSKVVMGPLGQPVEASFGIIDEGRTAVIEMATASGITLVPQGLLNPMLTTTYGTGQLIKEAVDQGCRHLLIGIGGSATNDGGVGMAQALGVRFLDRHGEEVGFGGGQVGSIHTIDLSGLDKRISECDIIVACDVDSPICGPAGASAVFGPQKGATPEMVKIMDRNLQHLSQLILDQLGLNVQQLRGGGAAGGLGAGLVAFLGATIQSGIDTILKTIRFHERVQEVDLVITGEGRTDHQTALGKTPAGVAQAAKVYNKPVICISGGISRDVQSLYDCGLDVIIGATQSPMTTMEAMQYAAEHIRHAAGTVMRILQLFRK